jgi:ABC-type lipoprotein release transport system permease subunit
VFGLFSVLFIFNFIIINIKNSTRDIGIYMSLGFSGFKIALIYFFQVVIMGLASFLLSVITTWVFLYVLDYRFTQIALVDLKIIKMTFLGIVTILGIATWVPTLATIFPLISLSKKHPIDVIKTN